MSAFGKSLEVLTELFGRDYTFVMATVKNNVPVQRVVDTFYYDGEFWIVTYALSNKVKEISVNPEVSLCNTFHTFTGKAYNEGHPFKTDKSV